MSENPVEWKKQKERGNSWVLQVTIFIYKVFGRRVCSLIIYPVSLYFCLTGKPARHASREFLSRVYNHPEGKKNFKRQPGFRESYRHFLSFSFSILDKFAVWIGRIKYDDIQWAERHIFVENLKKQGVVLLSAHYGNLEIMRAVSQLMTHMKINVIMDKKNAEAFNKILKQSNQQSDISVFSTEQVDISTAILLKEKLAMGEMVAIMADRMTDGSANRFEEREFLGESARFPQGPFTIAAILKAPVYLFICSKKNKKYHVNVEKICDSGDFSGKKRNVLVTELCDFYAKNLEKHCLEDPWQWYNFYDFWNKSSEQNKRTVKCES